MLKDIIINKKGFLVYTDYWDKYFNDMSGDQVKECLKIIFHYNKTFEILLTKDLAIKMVINTILDNINRDAEKREKQRKASSLNGKLGGRPKNQEKQQSTTTKNEKKEKKERYSLIQSQFEELWKEYKILHTPKGNKEKALDKFNKLLCKNKFEDIIRGTKVYIKNCHTKNIYTKQVISFLNGETWKEYLEIVSQSNTEQHTTDLINKLMNDTLINKIELTRSNKAKLYTTKKGFDKMKDLDEKLKENIKNLLTKELGTSGLEFNY